MILRPTRRYRSPWTEMQRLRRDIDRLFTDTSADIRRPGAAGYPAMNVWTNPDGAIVTAELPGINPEDIDISVQNDTLTLTGSRQPNALKEDEIYHRRERGQGGFTRSFQLPFHVEAGKVEAVFDKGILQVSLPRAEADKPKKITVKAG
jgi:HSP20 family protein